MPTTLSATPRSSVRGEHFGQAARVDLRCARVARRGSIRYRWAFRPADNSRRMRRAKPAGRRRRSLVLIERARRLWHDNPERPQVVTLPSTECTGGHDPTATQLRVHFVTRSADWRDERSRCRNLWRSSPTRRALSATACRGLARWAIPAVARISGGSRRGRQGLRMPSGCCVGR